MDSRVGSMISGILCDVAQFIYENNESVKDEDKSSKESSVKSSTSNATDETITKDCKDSVEVIFKMDEETAMNPSNKEDSLPQGIFFILPCSKIVRMHSVSDFKFSLLK